MNSAKFKENLDKYAQLIVEMGVNVKQSHTVVLQINVKQAPLARLITKKAYELKAAEVIVEWSDEIIQKEFLAHASFDRIENFPQYKIDQADEWIRKGASRISVISSDPGALADVDRKRVAAYQNTAGKGLAKLRKATQSNQVSWTVVAAAGENWKFKKVFPDLTKEQAVDALWNEIFKTARVDHEDPVAAWKKHDDALEAKANELNEQQFDTLHYKAPEPI